MSGSPRLVYMNIINVVLAGTSCNGDEFKRSKRETIIASGISWF